MPKIIQDNPYLTISAMKEQGTYEILPLVKKLYTQANKRLTTSTLNEVVKRIVEKNPPPSSGRGNFNILYASQVKTSPPTFVFFLNRKEALPSSYQHYLSNQLKERLKLKGQSIRLLYRSK
jgi:GTP-binding protein